MIMLNALTTIVLSEFNSQINEIVESLQWDTKASIWVSQGKILPLA